MAHIRQSRPNSGLGFHVKVVKPFKAFPSSLGSGFRAVFAQKRSGAVEPAEVDVGKEVLAPCEVAEYQMTLTFEFGTYKTVKARLWPWLSTSNP